MIPRNEVKLADATCNTCIQNTADVLLYYYM